MDHTAMAGVFGSPAVAILRALERDGFSVTLKGDGSLTIAPRAGLTADRMATIVAHKDALKVLVACVANVDVQARREVFQRQFGTGSTVFLFRTDVPYVAGTCFSCGAGLDEARFGRCWQCALAWRLAARVPVSADIAGVFDVAKVCA